MRTGPRSVRTTVLVLLAALVLPSLAVGGEAERDKKAVRPSVEKGPGAAREEVRKAASLKAPLPKAADALILWVPRVRRGAPSSRVGGATRSHHEGPTLHALVPAWAEASLTLASQPNLYWHLSEATAHPVNFTLIDPQTIHPLIDTMIPGPFRAGTQAVVLADYAVQLEIGRTYEWFVAVVHDPEDRSADCVAGGALRRVADEKLTSMIAESHPEALADLLARSGIWYDALDALSRPDRQAEEDPEVRQVRDALLKQVGLVLTSDR